VAEGRRATIASAERIKNAVRIKWTDGHSSTYHHLWLRDNCACDDCGAHSSGSRFQALLDIPTDISPTAIKAEASALIITWDTGHGSRYSADWLRKNCYSDSERERRRPMKTLWDSSLSELPTADYRLAQRDHSEKRKLFASVREFGFVIVRNVGTDCDETERLTSMIGYVRDTHFGRVTDLMLRTNGAHLSDFPTGILPHTDETYRHIPTGINVFHCIRPSDDGGGLSTLVDSIACARRLRIEDPEAFDLLTRLPIQHERRADGELIRSANPVFMLDYDGNVTEVRLNERTMSALSLPENLMEAAYRALRKAFQIAYDPASCLTFRLEAGDALVFDNLRVLHGRTAFAGQRHIRQSNVMRDEFYARLASLEDHAS
jgi:alpha-ketoglutarate-dependent taurine dioxygenase